jgi:hypothetical protein
MVKSLRVGIGVAALSLGTLLHIEASAATITACVASNGNMTYSSTGTCPRNQTPLTWNSTGPAGPTGAAGAGALLLYDVNNVVVGSMINQGTVLINHLGIPLILALNPDPTGAARFSGFADTNGASFFHTSPDCSGTRYMQYVYPGYPVYHQANTSYYGGAPQNITIASRSDFNGQSDFNGSPSFCQTFSTPSSASFGILTTLDTTTLGVAPFTVH